MTATKIINSVLILIAVSMGIKQGWAFHLRDGDFKGVVIEFPFLLLNMIIIFLKYPLPFKNVS